MSNRAWPLLILGAALVVVSTPVSAQACPEADASHQVYASGVYHDGVVAFEPSSNADYPIDVVLYRATNVTCQKSRIDAYSFEGAPPKVEAVFPYDLHGQPRLFVIVSWAVNHRGEGTYGTLYQVYAYGQDGKGGLVADKTIANSDAMTGIEGQSEGEPTHFHGKTPTEVRQLLKNLDHRHP
jgi:hypothetical protein